MDAQLDQILSQLANLSISQQELTRAIVGDEKVGHVGLIKRVAIIEDEHRQNPAILASIADARIDGDRRAHEHIEAVEKNITTKVTDLEHQTDNRADGIERKIDRFIWLSVGGAMATFGAGWLLGANVAPNLPLP